MAAAVQTSSLCQKIVIVKGASKETYAAPCRLERRQSSCSRTSSQESDRDSKRRELRIWMRRRQREQLAVYQKHRERLRERERQPFSRATVRQLYLFTFASAAFAFVFLYLVSSIFLFPLPRLHRRQQTDIQWPTGGPEKKEKSTHLLVLSAVCLMSTIERSKHLLMRQVDASGALQAEDQRGLVPGP